MMNKFPQFVFVAVREPGNQEYFVCENEAINAVEDDGPTQVATYQLVETHELSKRVVSKSTKNRTI